MENNITKFVVTAQDMARYQKRKEHEMTQQFNLVQAYHRQRKLSEKKKRS